MEMADNMEINSENDEMNSNFYDDDDNYDQEDLEEL